MYFNPIPGLRDERFWEDRPHIRTNIPAGIPSRSNVVFMYDSHMWHHKATSQDTVTVVKQCSHEQQTE